VAEDDTLRYFEDIEPGETFLSGPLVLTRESIRSFAMLYDPQPFHLDEAAARASVLGGLAASGWQTTAVGMRLYYDGFVRHIASMGAPGIDEGRWVKPVRPDDPLMLRIAITDKRASASRPDRGFISVMLDLRDGSDETVMTLRFAMIVQRRHATQAVRPPPSMGLGAAPAGLPDPDPMLTGFLEEIEIGHATILGSQLFTPEAIVTFASAYDPQYFHLDAERAKDSHFGGLVASGWQTAAMWMKSYIAARDRSGELRQSRGLPVAVGGPSPGFSALKWPRPVHAGETITFGMSLTSKRALPRPGWGLVQTHNTGHAADGSLVFSFDGRLLWPLAPA
jgi:acyl dehydratase